MANYNWPELPSTETATSTQKAMTLNAHCRAIAQYSIRNPQALIPSSYLVLFAMATSEVLLEIIAGELQHTRQAANNMIAAQIRLEQTAKDIATAATAPGHGTLDSPEGGTTLRAASKPVCLQVPTRGPETAVASASDGK
jgi:hypothetical protein